MPNNKEVHYLIKKQTFTFRLCSSCNGSGKCKAKKVQGHTFQNPCGKCKGTGKERFTHETEISLLQALKELNLIK